MRSFLLITAAVAVAAATTPATADNPGIIPGFQTIQRDITVTQVVPALYYTQLKIDASNFAVPKDDRAQKKLGKAILAALGMKKETRSIVLSAVVSTGLATYPEYPLLVYKFDGQTRLLSVDRVATVSMPLQRLDPAETVKIKLAYRQSTDVAFDMDAARDLVQGLIPSSTLVSLATAPFVTKAATLAGNVFSLAASSQTNFSLSDQLGPYGSLQPKTIVVEANKPDGTAFGTITLQLLATPTLLRASELAKNADQTADFKLRAGEDPAALSITDGGVARNLITEIKGLPEFTTLSKDKSEASAKAFCVASRTKLETFRVTTLDRSLVVFEALHDVEPTQTTGAWYDSCFAAQEAKMLSQASTAFAKAPITDPTIDPAGPIPKSLKPVIGCVMTDQEGKYCTKEAPNARQTLLDAMTDQVKIGQMDYAGLIDVNTIDASTRLVPKATLVDLMTKKADKFGCYEHGLYVGVDNDTKAYSLGATVTADNKISGIQTVTIAVEDLECH